MKILIATQKPFSTEAVSNIKTVLNDQELVILEKYKDKDELIKAIKDVDGVIVRSDKIDDEVISAADNLKIIVRAGAGYDNIDLDSATRHKIVVMNTPGQNANAVAELAIAMMIFMARNQFTQGTGTELKYKYLGVHAYGNVGRLVGEKGKSLDMKIKAYDPFISKDSLIYYGAIPTDSTKELYSTCDYVSIHIPATPENIKSIGYDLITSMSKNATLINTARKEVIDEDGLLRALEDRPDLKYAADVAPDNIDLLKEKFGTRVFATPKKMGAETNEANTNAGRAAAQQILDFFNNNNRKFQVNRWE